MALVPYTAPSATPSLEDAHPAPIVLALPTPATAAADTTKGINQAPPATTTAKGKPKRASKSTTRPKETWVQMLKRFEKIREEGLLCWK